MDLARVYEFRGLIDHSSSPDHGPQSAGDEHAVAVTDIGAKQIIDLARKIRSLRKDDQSTET